MILLTKGEYYTDGFPWKVSDTKKLAKEYLRIEGYKYCKKEDLFTKVESGNSVWVRLEKIDKLKERIEKIESSFAGISCFIFKRIIE